MDTRKRTREEEFEEMDRFGAELDSGTHPLSPILSVEAVRESRDRIHRAILDTIVQNGHGVYLRDSTT